MFTLEFFQLFLVFEHFYNKILEKQVKAEWVAKTQMSESGHLLQCAEKKSKEGFHKGSSRIRFTL